MCMEGVSPIELVWFFRKFASLGACFKIFGAVLCDRPLEVVSSLDSVTEL